MEDDTTPVRRRTVLKTIGASTVASGVFAGVSLAQDATVSPGESIQTAIDDADPGDVILVEDGTYEETLDVRTDGLTIRGESRDGVVVDASNQSGRAINVDDADDVTLETFTLVGTPDDYGFKIQFCEDVTVANVTIEDAYRTAVDLNAVRGATIEDVEATATAWGNGIALTDTKHAVLDGVTVADNEWGGIALYTSTYADVNRVTDVVIKNSSVSGNPSGVYLQNSGETSENPFTEIELAGNEFEANDLQVAEIDTSNALKSAVDWLDFGDVVDDNDFDTAATVHDNPIVVPAVFSSIQDAIDAAATGETVVVEPGTYDEDVTVDVGDLAVEGPNAGVAGYGARGDEATVEGQVVLSADGTAFDGFDVSPPPAQSTQTSEAVRVSNTPDDVVVANNVVRDFERDDSGGGWYGVDGINVFGGDAADPIENAAVRANKVQHLRNEEAAGAAGISVQGNVAGAVVADNVVTDIAEEVTAYGFGVVIRGTGNHDEVPEGVDLIGNDLRNVLSDPASEFDGVGFEVEADGTDYLATENRIEANNLGVEVKTAADETTIDFNDIADNSRRGVLNVDDAVLDASDNWWGHASGPSGPDGRQNPAGKAVGKGDAIEGDVTFDPWLQRSIDHPSR